MPDSLGAKLYFDGFQFWEKASGVVATPCSPIPADLASEVIKRNGTPVVITRFCPYNAIAINTNTTEKKLLILY